MKLATYKDGSRDGQLVVVSRDLSSAHYASGIATRAQQLLDDWNFVSPQLQDLYTTLNHGRARHAFAFDAAMCMAPLPRAFQRAWADADALRQRSGDDLGGPCDAIAARDAHAGLDFGVGLAAVSGDIAAGCTPEAALEGVRLLMLANDMALRCLDPADGAIEADPGTAFGPVAVTPDELGDAWRGGRVFLAVDVLRRGKSFGRIDVASAMPRHFGQVIAQLARTRPLRAGSIVGVGPLASAEGGFGCIAAKRAREAAEHGETKTAWLEPGDRLCIEAKGADGASVFGAIEQAVAARE